MTPPAAAAEQSLDFFISYSPADERWATWLAGTLESAGYRTMLQAWDFVAGSRFIELMDRGVSESAIILAVLSGNYLKSRYGRMEWQAALRAAPEHPETRLITVRVEDCDITGLLAQITYIDLVGVDTPEQARALVLQRVRAALAGRARPERRPSFPGAGDAIASEPSRQELVPAQPRRLPSIAPRYPAAAGHGVGRSSVTLLHVSGPQLGNAVTAATALPEPDLHARIFGEVTELVHNGAPRPDLLVVSGDLTVAGGRRQFEAARDMLCRLRVQLGLGPDRLIVVPGPMDVNRAACRAHFNECEADDREPTPPYWPKWRHFSWLFRELYQGIDNILFECGQPWTLFVLPEMRLVIAGLNSSMAISHRQEDEYGAIGYEQASWFANRLHEYEDVGWLRVGVMRHAPGSDRHALRDTSIFERLIAPRLNLLLHGPGPASVDADPHGVDADPPHLSLPRPGAVELLELTPGGLTVWGERTGGRPQRIERGWQGADAAFSAAPPQPREDVTVREVLDPVDHLLDRIEEVCRARHERVRVRRVKGARQYLIVTYNDAGVIRELVIAAHVGEPGAEHVEKLRQLASPVDAGSTLEVVYDGPPPTYEIREHARGAGIRLRSLVEFQGLLDLRSYVAAQTARLTADRQYPPHLYVSQRYSELDRAEQPVRDGLVEELLRQLGSDHGRFVLLLGEFGRGKTYALRELARRIPTELPHLVPILIELRSLDKAHSIEGLVAAHLADHGEQHIDLRAFQYMLRQGRIVLLFDGFDELVIRTTYDRAADHLDTLLEAAVDSAKIVVTSRTQHFKSRAQVLTKLGERVGMLPQRRLLSVEEFTPEQIREYLVNHYDGDAQQAEARMRLIEGVGNLRALSRNPRMLGFVALLDAGRLHAVAKAGHALSAATLYREILSSWLAFEESRAHDIRGAAPAGLTIDELWRTVTILALRLWESNESVLRLADLAEVADTLTGLAESPLSVEQTTHAIGAGTLLVRTDDALFGFIHGSVVEWLVANEIAAQLSKGNSVLLNRRRLSQLSIDFLCDLAEARLCEEWVAAVQADPDSSEIAGSNARMIGNRLRVSVHADLRGASMRNEDLSYRDFGGVDLTDADLSDARLVGANLTDAVLRGARLVGARLDEAVLCGADLTGADLSRARLIRSDLRRVRAAGSRWSRAALVVATTDADLVRLPELRGASVAPGMPAEPQLAPATIGVPYGFHIQFGRLPLPLAYSDDGSLVAAGCGNGSVVICDTLTGLPIRTLRGHRGRVYAVVAIPGDTLVTAGADHAVCRWDIATGERLWTSMGQRDWVWPVVVGASGALLAISDSTGEITVLDTATGAVRRRLSGGTAPIWTAEFSSDGRLLAAGGSSSDALVWDVETGQLVHRLTGHSGTRPERDLAGHTGSVYRVAYHPDGHLLATSGEAGTVRVWDLGSGQVRHRFDDHTRSVFSMSFHPGGDLLASADTRGVVHVWRLSDGRRVDTLEAHVNVVYQAQFSADGSLLATCDSGGVARLWSVDAAAEPPVRPRVELVGHRAAVWPGRFHPSGRQFATAGNDGTVRLWDTTTGRCRHVLRGHGRRISSVSFSPTRSQLAACGNDGIVRLWEPVTGQLIRSFTGIVDRLVSAVFSPTGSTIASASNDGGVYLLSADTGATGRELDVGTENVWAEAFSPDGQLLATANDDDTVRLWYHRTGAQGHTLADHKGRVRSIAFDSSGEVIATGCDDGKVRLWDAENGTCRATLTGHTDRVYAVGFGPDGAEVASAGWDGTIRVWDSASGACRLTLDARAGRLWTIAYHPSAGVLASAGDDGDIQMWDLATGRCLSVQQGHSDRVLALAFSPDGVSLASGADDGTVRLWDVRDPTAIRHRVTLVGGAEGWAAIGADGRYKRDGAITGEFWHTIGACRFEPGELDPHLSGVRLLPAEAPFE